MKLSDSYKKSVYRDVGGSRKMIPKRRKVGAKQEYAGDEGKNVRDIGISIYEACGRLSRRSKDLAYLLLIRRSNI